jgi:hypothetical protein
MSDLTWKTDWSCVVSYEDSLLPNDYQLTINFDIVTDNQDEQHIAFDRITYFVDNVLQDAIFCDIDDKNVDFYMNNFKQKLVTFVQAPQDLTVVATLFAKFIAITEGHINIESMSLNSRVGNRITINFDADFAEESNMLVKHELITAAEKTPWWFREDCGSADYFIIDEDPTKITFVTDVSSWEASELMWPDTDKKTAKNEKNWNPTIIPGGKTHH